MARARNSTPAAVLLGGLLALLALPAAGHQQFAPSTVNRYGKLVLSGQHGLRLIYTLMVGATPAATLRSDGDMNHDGRLDPAEQSRICAQLGSRVREGLALSIDGTPPALTWETPQCAFSGTASQPSDSLGDLPFSVEIAANFAPPSRPGEHIVRYEDRVTAPPIGEVELRLEDGPDIALLASWQGAPPTPSDPAPKDGVQRQFQTIGPPRSSMSDRSISLRFAIADRPLSKPQWPRPRWPHIVGALLLAVALLSGARRALRHAR
jgi:hypothetical protein